MVARRDGGFTIIELMVSLTILLVAMSGLAGMMLRSSRINKSQQMTAEMQTNARTCLSLVVQKLRSAGWDPRNTNLTSVVLDSDLSDDASEIEVFADLDEDDATSSLDEQILFRHSGDLVTWRRTAGGTFSILAINIINDEDGDGIPEPMFTPDTTPNPTRITVKVTAQSPIADPVSGKFLRYTVSSDVVMRKEI